MPKNTSIFEEKEISVKNIFWNGDRQMLRRFHWISHNTKTPLSNLEWSRECHRYTWFWGKNLMINIDFANMLREFLHENNFQCTHGSKFLGTYLCAVWFDWFLLCDENWISCQSLWAIFLHQYRHQIVRPLVKDHVGLVVIVQIFPESTACST